MNKVNIPADVRQRLFDKTDQSQPHWIYPGSGKIKIDDRWYRARQLWWAIANDGEIPLRMDSTCRVDGCCNPDHWYDSTKSQRPPCPAEKEVLFHSRHKYYYVANVLTGGKQIRLCNDRGEAVDLWREGREILKAGHHWHPGTSKATRLVTIGALCTAFRLDARKRALDGKIVIEHQNSMINICNKMVAHFGSRTPIANLKPNKFTEVSDALKVDMVTGKLRNWGGYKSEVGKIRHVFSWAKKNDLIREVPRYGDNFPIAEDAYNRIANRNRREGNSLQPKKAPPKTFKAAEIRVMLDVAPVDIRAWIYVGLNLALENKEISLLSGCDVKQASNGEWWCGEPRIKTSQRRLAHVWDETAEALLEAKSIRPRPASDKYNQRFFLTTEGRPVRATSSNCTFCKRFREVMKAADCYIATRGFRTLRHTFRTQANACNDQEACEYVMGHKSFGDGFSPESPTYVESVARDRLRKVSLTLRDWLWNEEETEDESEFVATMEF